MKTKKLKAAFTAGTPAPGQPVGFYLNKLLNLHQLQFLPLKALNLVESLVSHIRWIAPSPRKGGHTLESMSMDMKSIGAPNVPREDDGVTISPRDTTNGSSCSLSTKKSRNRNMLRLSRGNSSNCHKQQSGICQSGRVNAWFCALWCSQCDIAIFVPNVLLHLCHIQ